MQAWLIAVVMLSGSGTWGPTLTVTPVPSMAACQVLRKGVEDSMVKTVAKNLTVQMEAASDGDDRVVSTAMGRPVARLTCTAIPPMR